MMRESDQATPILIVPGLGGSGPEHWQTHWERSYPRAQRVEQADWNRPVRADWLSRLTQALRDAPGAILVGHSLGCALIAHLAWRRPDLAIGGALLVAPADVDDDDRIPRDVRDFAPMPLARLPFRAAVVASTNDPYMGLERARTLAKPGGPGSSTQALAATSISRLDSVPGRQGKRYWQTSCARPGQRRASHCAGDPRACERLDQRVRG